MFHAPPVLSLCHGAHKREPKSAILSTLLSLGPRAPRPLFRDGTRYAEIGRPIMRTWLTALATPLLLLAFPASAWPQTVTLQSSGITRVNSDGSMVTTKSTTNMNVFARVNGADCYGS